MVQKARRGRRERKAGGHLSHLRREEIEGTQFSSHFFFTLKQCLLCPMFGAWTSGKKSLKLEL